MPSVNQVGEALCQVRQDPCLPSAILQAAPQVSKLPWNPCFGPGPELEAGNTNEPPCLLGLRSQGQKGTPLVLVEDKEAGSKLHGESISFPATRPKSGPRSLTLSLSLCLSMTLETHSVSLILRPLGGAVWCSVHATGMGAVITTCVIKDTKDLGTEVPVSPMVSGPGSMAENT